MKTEELHQHLLSAFVFRVRVFNSFCALALFPVSQALENENAALFSESDALTESECDVTSDSALSDSTSNKDSRVHTESKKKDRPSGELNLHLIYLINEPHFIG